MDGSLYVASPPGIWKFTDTDGDGVADQRKLLVEREEIEAKIEPARKEWQEAREVASEPLKFWLSYIPKK